MTNTTHQAVEAADLLPCPFCGEKPELHSGQDTSCKDNFTLACCAGMESTDKSALFSNWNNRATLSLPQEVAAEVGSEAFQFAIAMLAKSHGVKYPEDGRYVFTPAQLLAFSTELAASRSTAPAGVASGVDASRMQRYSFAFDGAEMPIAVPHHAGNWVKYEDVAATQAQPSPHPAVGGSGGVPVSEVLGETCIDGGTCHHECADRCFRRECCAPLTVSGLTMEQWQYPATKQGAAK